MSMTNLNQRIFFDEPDQYYYHQSIKIFKFREFIREFVLIKKLLDWKIPDMQQFPIHSQF